MGSCVSVPHVEHTSETDASNQFSDRTDLISSTHVQLRRLIGIVVAEGKSLTKEPDVVEGFCDVTRRTLIECRMHEKLENDYLVHALTEKDSTSGRSWQKEQGTIEKALSTCEKILEKARSAENEREMAAVAMTLAPELAKLERLYSDEMRFEETKMLPAVWKNFSEEDLIRIDNRIWPGCRFGAQTGLNSPGHPLRTLSPIRTSDSRSGSAPGASSAAPGTVAPPSPSLLTGASRSLERDRTPSTGSRDARVGAVPPPPKQAFTEHSSLRQHG